MRVIITGGTGFIGLALTEALQATGHEITLFGRTPMPERFGKVLGDVVFEKGDITRAGDVDKLFGRAAPEAIVHLAAVTPDREAEIEDPATVVAVNVGGTANLLRAASRLTRSPKILLASSVAVYGETPPSGIAYREADDVPNPVSLYGITKFGAERVAQRLAALYGIDLTTVRLGPVYGPWEYNSGQRPVLSPHAQVVDLWRRGEHAVLPRRLVGDWLYSRDAGRGLAALLFADRLSHGIYNLGGETISDLMGWCEQLESLSWAKGWRIACESEDPNVIIGLSTDRAALDIDRLRIDTGFHPRFDVPSAAKDFLSWFATSGGKLERVEL